LLFIGKLLSLFEPATVIGTAAIAQPGYPRACCAGIATPAAASHSMVQTPPVLPIKNHHNRVAILPSE